MRDDTSSCFLKTARTSIVSLPALLGRRWMSKIEANRALAVHDVGLERIEDAQHLVSFAFPYAIFVEGGEDIIADCDELAVANIHSRMGAQHVFSRIRLRSPKSCATHFGHETFDVLRIAVHIALLNYRVGSVVDPDIVYDGGNSVVTAQALVESGVRFRPRAGSTARLYSFPS